MIKRWLFALLLFAQTAYGVVRTPSTSFSWRMESSAEFYALPNTPYINGSYSYGPGKFGNALFFGSSTDGGVPVNTQMLDPFANGAITVSAWFNPTVTGVYFFAYGSDTNSSCFPAYATLNSDLSVTAGVCQVGVSCSSATTSALSAGSWQHFAMTFANNGTLKIYINGQVAATNSSPMILAPSWQVTRLQFGSNAFTASGMGHCNGLAGTYYQGGMDEFQVYSKEMSAADIRRLMLNYSPGEH